jgi:hypothetical protein
VGAFAKVLAVLKAGAAARTARAAGATVQEPPLAAMWVEPKRSPPTGRFARVLSRLRLSAEVREAFLNYGVWVAVNSSNVLAVRYDPATSFLAVRFKKATKGVSEPVYSYRITPEIAEALSRSTFASIGTWVWDNLRARGTARGHRKGIRVMGPF